MEFQDLSLFELIKRGGIAMWPLFLCSFILLWIAIEKWISVCFKTRRLNQEAEEFIFRIEEVVLKGGIMEAITICEVTGGPLGRIFKAGLLKHDRSKEEFLDTIRTAEDYELKSFRKNIWVLATIGSIAPFIGLFGTVIGIMRAFSSIATSGSSGINVVAAGISEALVATAGGLVVAVIGIVFYNFFQIKTSELIHELRFYSLRLIDMIGDRRGW
ncbi:MAG: MotA/TolQ/ExbB proton channel family protein [bacterium]